MKSKYFLLIIVILLVFNICTPLTSAAQTINSTENNEEILSTLEDKEILTESFKNSIVQNLTSTILSTTTINLSWSELDNATSYEVYQSVNSDSDFRLIDTVSSTSHTIQNVIPGTTNYFKVRAVQDFENPIIYSQFSNIDSVITSLTTPSNFKVASKTINSISLSWDKVDDVEGYEIWMATSRDGTYSLVNTTTDTSFKHTNLPTNKTYYYKIRAYTENKSSYSSYSSIASTKISFATPTNLKVTTKTHNSISLSWSKVNGAEGYEIWMATSKDGTYQKVNTTKSTSFKHTNLTINKTYYYKIRAYSGNKTVYSSYTSITSAKTTLISPSKFKVASKNTNSVSLSWSKVSGANGYEIWMATSKNGKYTKINTTAASSFKHTKLTTNKTYYYKIRAYVKIKNKTYYSSFSNVINGKPTLSTVTSVKTTGGLSSIKISWGTVIGATSYKVYRSTSKNGKYSLLTTTKSTSYTDKSVTKRKTYYYKIVATKTVGKNNYNGPSSAVVSGITRAALKPNIYVLTSDSTYYSTSVALLYIENYGTKPIRILSTGLLYDANYESYDRLLQLIDTDTIKDLAWHQIGANRYDYVGYRVIGSSTWYDYKTTIIFEFLYDGVEYTGFVSNFSGFTYKKK